MRSLVDLLSSLQAYRLLYECETTKICLAQQLGFFFARSRCRNRQSTRGAALSEYLVRQTNERRQDQPANHLGLLARPERPIRPISQPMRDRLRRGQRPTPIVTRRSDDIGGAEGRRRSSDFYFIHIMTVCLNAFKAMRQAAAAAAAATQPKSTAKKRGRPTGSVDTVQRKSRYSLRSASCSAHAHSRFPTFP